MSQMCPSSSHQLVAAAFRRARKKFPKNFGQLPRPVKYESKQHDSGVSCTRKTCKNCDERFSCREIRNSRSNNVWPSFGGSRTIADPRSTKSMRENATSLIRRNSNDRTTTTTRTTATATMTMAKTSHVVCPCRRRICKSWKKRNFAVSFSEMNEKSKDRRISGGDAGNGEEASSNETVSCKSCDESSSKTRRRARDCCYVEKKRQESMNDREKNNTRRRNKIEKKTSVKRDSCVRDESSEDFGNIDRLDLLYDRGNRTSNAVSFSSVSKESVVNVSQEEEEQRRLDFPSKHHEWGNRTQSFEPDTERGRINRDEEIVVNCDCVRHKNEQDRGESFQEHRSGHHSHRRRHKPDQYPQESSTRQDLLSRSGQSLASSFNETNRLCKDCALAKCSTKSILISCIRENTSKDHEEECTCRGDDVCAIKHKDSMAILVEKFKNKKIVNFSDDDNETTIVVKSEEELSSDETNVSERKIEIFDDEEYRELCDDNENVTCWKDRRNHAGTKFYDCPNPKSLESRVVRSGHRCSVKEN